MKLKTLRNLIKSREFDKFFKQVEENIQLLEKTEEGKILIFLKNLLSNQQVETKDLESINLDSLSGYALSDLALVYLLSGNTEKAVQLLKKAINTGQFDEATFARLAAAYYSIGELEKAKENWEKSLQIAPNKPEILYNLSSLYITEGQFEKALEYINNLLNVEPNFPNAEEKRNLILLSLNKIDQLIEEYYQKIHAEKTAENYIKLANLLITAGKYEQAIAILNEAVKTFNENKEVKLLLVDTLEEQGFTFKAGAMLKQWIEEPSWIKEEEKEETLTLLRFKLNELRISQNFLETAEKDIEEIPNKENYPQYYLLKAKLLMEQNKGEEAYKVLEEGLEKFPAHLGILNQIVHTLTSIGELEKAKEYQEKVVAINPAAVIQQVEMENYKATEEQQLMLETLLNSVAHPKEVRASAGFTLHKVLEKKKEYDKAFEVLIKANELIKETINYDWKEHRLMIQNTIEVFTPEVVKKLYGKGHPSSRPIFVLGMPRSGTTLTEQILGTHSLVYPAGELGFVPKIVSLIPEALKIAGKKPKNWPFAITDFDENLLKSAGQYYLDRVAQLDDKHPFIVDKLPHNFDYVGLILLMFPNAKIIHLVRDDLDVAVSNYQQNFAAKHGTMGFAFDLRWIGHMLNDHRAIMEHWKKLFPDKIFDLDYEKLTQSPEETIKELLQFCGLPWEDKVLEFYKTKRPVKTASIKQVRQGIYKSSVKKWKRYEKFLQPTIKIIKEGFKKLDENTIQKYEDAVRPTGFVGYTLPN